MSGQESSDSCCLTPVEELLEANGYKRREVTFFGGGATGKLTMLP